VRFLLLVAFVACAPAQAEPPAVDAAPATTPLDAGTAPQAVKRRKGKSALEAVMRARLRYKNASEDLGPSNKQRRCSAKHRCPSGWLCVKDGGVQVCKQVNDSEILERSYRPKADEADPLAPFGPP
jgi:hypothetical protein